MSYHYQFFLLILLLLILISMSSGFPRYDSGPLTEVECKQCKYKIFFASVVYHYSIYFI